MSWKEIISNGLSSCHSQFIIFISPILMSVPITIFFSYISASFSIFAFLLISLSSYKTQHVSFWPSLLFFPHFFSKVFFTFLFSLFSSGELGCLKREYKSDRRSRHSSLPYDILYNFFRTISTFPGNQKIAGKSCLILGWDCGHLLMRVACAQSCSQRRAL